MVYEVSEYIYWDDSNDSKIAFDDYNFILPDISIGNVGQLTVDLMLNNLTVKHLGRVVHPCFYPFIGSDPFNLSSDRLSSSCEIYECKDKKLFILQIRSRVFPSKFEEFGDLIFQLIKKFSFKQTIVITSGSSAYFPAEQLQHVPLHYLATSKFAEKQILDELKWRQFSFPSNVDVADKAFIPGSYVSHSLLQRCETENLPLVTLICLCNEGDNYPEAFRTADCADSWLRLKQVKDAKGTWKIPVSWNLPYGSAAPHTIY